MLFTQIECGLMLHIDGCVKICLNLQFVFEHYLLASDSICAFGGFLLYCGCCICWVSDK